MCAPEREWDKWVKGRRASVCASEHRSVCVQRSSAAHPPGTTLRALWRVPHLQEGVILVFLVHGEEVQPNKLPWRVAVGGAGKNVPQEPSLGLLAA